MTRSRWIALAVVAVIGLSIVAVRFSGHDAAQKPATTDKPEIVKVGYIPVTHCLPLYVGVEEGFFAKENLQVQLLPLAGGSKILEALAAGEIDIGFSNVVSPMLARSQGLPFVVFGGGAVEDERHRDHAIMVRKDDPAASVKDLKGRTIALNTRRAIDHLMLLLLFEKYGLSEKDVNVVELPFPRMLPALSSKAADAIANAEPFVTLGLDSGDAKILDWNYTDVRPVTYVATYVTHENFVRQRRNVLTRFERALSAATKSLGTDAASARKILARYTKLEDAVAAKVRLPRFEPTLDRENIAETMRLARKFGILEKDVDLDQLLLK
jgi:NitT/TauT family transport system substrate-binding protein